ncbi:hypothetical protein A2U01_0104167 [Trifolium medium]|uniref:Uncharacterized protein n=1 Tax=Trifolium medium TaxID=97028 RepID=A0A392V643_9FABA|nr:hypothetical protein [Trifolium medium]
MKCVLEVVLLDSNHKTGQIHLFQIDGSTRAFG